VVSTFSRKKGGGDLEKKTTNPLASGKKESPCLKDGTIHVVGKS